MSKKYLFILTVISLFSFILNQKTQAQMVRQLTLKECVEFAISNHKNNVNARVDEFIAEEKVKELIAVGYPQVNSSLDIRYNAIIPTSLVPAQFFGGQPGEFAAVKFGTNWNTTIGASISQLVFDGTFFLGVKAAKEYVELTRRNNKRAEVETAATVSKAYYTVLVAERRLDLLRNGISQLESLQKNTQALLNNGFAEKLDVDRITVNLNNSRTELDKALKLVELSRLLLKFQMGMPIEDKVVLTDKIAVSNTKEDFLSEFGTIFSDTNSIATVENRPEYHVLSKNLQLQEMNVKRLKVGYYPSVALYGNLQAQAQRQTFDIVDPNEKWYPISVIGLQVNFKIFDGFQRKAQIQQAMLEQVKVKNEINYFKNAVSFEFQDAKTRITNSIKDLQIQQRNMDLAKEVYRVTDLKYREGVGTNIEVINADIEFKQAQTNYINSLLEAYLSRVDMQKALGILYK